MIGNPTSNRTALRSYASVGVILALLFVALPVASDITSTKSTTFRQNLYVNGTVSKGSGTFMIDHPLDPKNKLLYHSFFESPDMKNWYDGTITLDEFGEATVLLPDYFMALNSDYRYLVTSLSGPMPNLHLKREVRRQWFLGDPSFRIAGGVPGGEVSWQVTGIRKDPFALQNPIVTEVLKDDSELVEKGEYLFPEYYEKKN